MTAVIQTSRLSFREFTADDYDAVQAYAGNPEVTRYTAWGPNTPERTKEFLQLAAGQSSEADRGHYTFALIHKQTNKLIGSCGLMRSDTNGPQYSFGYVLHKDWWRQGLASEATAELVRFGFGELRAHRLWAHVFVGNTGSEKLLQKLGFRYEGCALKAFFVRDTWHDLQTFAMLRSEWEKRISPAVVSNA
jgi:[ribosomal protein S5]-alanine N-acetyltransferase